MVTPARSKTVLAAALSLSLLLHAAPVRADDGVALIRDTEIEEILRKDSEPIFKAAGVDAKSIDILLIGSKELNAFAAPGTMGVFTGLILESENPNQLQGVIAHEVGHLAAGHSARSGEMNAAGMKPFLLTMGLGVLAALAGSGEGAASLIGSASYFGTLGAMGYSREQESRADQAGAALLERARDEPDWLRMLTERSVARSPRFSPEAESRSLLDLLAALLPAAPPARPG